MFQWLLGQFTAILRSELHKTEQRLMSKVDELKTQEDREGAAILRAVAQNSANLQKIKDALANGADSDALSALVDEAKSHADTLEANFPADPAPAGDTAAAQQ